MTPCGIGGLRAAGRMNLFMTYPFPCITDYGGPAGNRTHDFLLEGQENYFHYSTGPLNVMLAPTAGFKPAIFRLRTGRPRSLDEEGEGIYSTKENSFSTSHVRNHFFPRKNLSHSEKLRLSVFDRGTTTSENSFSLTFCSAQLSQSATSFQFVFCL